MKWEKYRLSEIMSVIGGGTPKSGVSDYWNGEIPWLSIKDFHSDRKIVFETEKYITELGLQHSSAKLLNKGDLVISARGTVGALAQVGKQMSFNQSCYGLRAKDVTTNDYLYYLLKDKINILQQNAHGSVFDTITRKTFDNLIVAVPDLETQIEITDVLSSLDRKVEIIDRINQNLHLLKRVIKAMIKVVTRFILILLGKSEFRRDGPGHLQTLVCGF